MEERALGPRVRLAAGAAATPKRVVEGLSRRIRVGVTPLPAAPPLFATGLGALGMFGWVVICCSKGRRDLGETAGARYTIRTIRHV